MRVRVAVAVVLIVVGAVWIGQGIGMIEGSFMTDEIVWAVIGGIAVLFGVSLLIGVSRERNDRDS